MADIDIVSKRKSHVWVWVILAVIVASILWAFLSRNDALASGSGIPDPEPVVQTSKGNAPGNRA